MKTLMKRAAVFAAGITAGMTLAAAVTAQTDYASIEASPALWSISDADSTVYLFGTVHILPPELNWRSEAINAALDDAETVYFEADVLSPEAQAQMQQLIPQLAVNTSGAPLSARLSDEAKANISIIAGQLGQPADAFMASLDPLQPWFASLQIAVLQIMAGGYDPQSGVEQVLHASASEAGKSFGYFETVEQQLRFFADLPQDVQLADLESGLAQMVEDPDFLSELVQAWAVGDADAVGDLMSEGMRDSSEELFQAIFVDRNQAWIPLIEEALASEDDAFIAVGAGHMPGELGVLALLAANGHEVERR